MTTTQGPRATFSNRPFSDAPDTKGFPFKKAMRRIAGTGTFTVMPRHRKGGRAGMRKTAAAPAQKAGAKK